ncbi:MAG: 2-amino-4-hydroxy-6-hydroxymethyldihydropteridine diphosphokinase [Actinobacteria bacterium]|nr:2-amino-4-hydroxy-6-hydroxymethyldihydropteridine diphosphokinase [Actinomycetota bacterium]
MLDRISIAGLRARGHHGVFDHEREAGQDFVIDAVLWLDTAPAAASDDLGLTADYGGVASRLAEIVTGPPVALIETLADRLASACLADPVVREAEVTVHKPQAPVAVNLTDISVTIRRTRTERNVVLALGSNLGDRMANLQRGIDTLGNSGITATAVSGIFETTPVGGPEQGNYLNAVVRAQNSLPAREILARCQAAEAAAGRVRTVRWGPRTLDVDIIACGTETSADPDLTLPHPRAHERAFVLAPWLDIEPDAELPGRGPVADLLAAIPVPGVWRRPELRLMLPAPTVAAGSAPAVTPCT